MKPWRGVATPKLEDQAPSGRNTQQQMVHWHTKPLQWIERTNGTITKLYRWFMDPHLSKTSWGVVPSTLKPLSIEGHLPVVSFCAILSFRVFHVPPCL